MAPSSHQSQINHSDQSRAKFSSSSYTCGSSKAQLCLQKILHIILTIPTQPLSENDIKDVPPPPPPPPPPEEEELKDPPTSPAATTPPDKGLALNVEGKGVQVVEAESDNMGVLIDAAKMVFGETKESHDQRKNQSSEDPNDQDLREKPCVDDNKRRNQCWTVDLYEDMEPVVRSKRGRTRVLPCKYRDSVLEPLTRASRNRASIVSNKRRLR